MKCLLIIWLSFLVNSQQLYHELSPPESRLVFRNFHVFTCFEKFRTFLKRMPYLCKSRLAYFVLVLVRYKLEFNNCKLRKN